MKYYVYGIDLAQSLNYTAIIVTEILKKKIKIAAIRKHKNLMYPELQKILFDDLFKRLPPKRIVVDYTNEKSFAGTMESEFNSSFTNSSSSGYQRWKMVMPMIFTQDTKLEMKQNARQILEKKQFVWPNRLKTDPRVWGLVEELKAQMLREFGSPGINGQLKFPKPEGHDNDLIIALELNLYGAKEFLNKEEDDRYTDESDDSPMSQYKCVPCKNGNHPGPGNHDVIYWEDFRGKNIDCPCKICYPS